MGYEPRNRQRITKNQQKSRNLAVVHTFKLYSFEFVGQNKFHFMSMTLLTDKVMLSLHKIGEANRALQCHQFKRGRKDLYLDF